MKLSILFLSLALPLLSNAQTLSAQPVPDCMSKGQVLSMDNAEVINWKATTANQFHARAHIVGKLLQVYADHSGHHHLEVSIGPNSGDSIEIIYNEAFGAIPPMTPGMDVEACGDYITSNAPSGHYPPSPDGAIVHWVHKSPSSSHDSGYLVINGEVCGQGSAGGGTGTGGKHGHGAHGN